MADSRRLENRKLAISHYGAERVSQAYRLSAFLKLIFLMECALERLVLRHHANFFWRLVILLQRYRNLMRFLVKCKN